MLQFKQNISLVALVIIGMISHLLLGRKQSIQTPSTKYLEHLFSSIAKSNIEIQRWNLGM